MFQEGLAGHASTDDTVAVKASLRVFLGTYATQRQYIDMLEVLYRGL
jgi:hypothetical protein